jgi:sec-independent protein translocase protein TatA
MLPNLQPGEMMIILLLAVLFFGKRLPEVGRSLGKGIVEFKKGLRGVTDEFEEPSPTYSSSARSDYSRPHDDAGTISVPKFELPTSAPTPKPAQEANLHAD